MGGSRKHRLGNKVAAQKNALADNSCVRSESSRPLCNFNVCDALARSILRRDAFLAGGYDNNWSIEDTTTELVKHNKKPEKQKPEVPVTRPTGEEDEAPLHKIRTRGGEWRQSREVGWPCCQQVHAAQYAYRVWEMVFVGCGKK